MEIYALIGSSGTGKSYKAYMVAKDKEINYIIDDGLLINGARIVAGTSAKKESTKIAAVRRALFKDKAHKESVIKSLEQEKPDKLLIIGTSQKMIDQIIEALNLPSVNETIFIEDISTQKEIEMARKSRKEDGKHVIPVPALEIKKDFSGYFIDSLKIFRKKDKHTDVAEKTIIRPTFSYLGKYNVSTAALIQMVTICASDVLGVGRVIKVRINKEPHGAIINIELSIVMARKINYTLMDVQEKVKREIEYMTGLNIIRIDVEAKSIYLEGDELKRMDYSSLELNKSAKDEDSSEK